jgi:N-(2-amino-2-carboxyethyl)-L-glutamate synthase
VTLARGPRPGPAGDRSGACPGERIGSSVLDAVGATPLVELARMFPQAGVQVLAKLELMNPGGSMKDRSARHIVGSGVADGSIPAGSRLVESSSGNFGVAVAMAARLHGLAFTCVVDPHATPASVTIMRGLGADVETVDEPDAAGGYLHTRLARVHEILATTPDTVWINQYANDRNWLAHYHGTGAEIAEALDRVEVLVAGLGTGGTLMGAGARLREAFPDLVVAAAEPLPGDPVMGLRSLEDGYVPPILDISKLDRKVLVSNEESVRGLRELLDREGVLAGVSSGAVVHVARKLAGELDEGVVVCVLPDGGWKYLSAPFWRARDVESSMERSLWW